MTKVKHPQNRRERLEVENKHLYEKKQKRSSRLRSIEEIRKQETEDDLKQYTT